MNLLSQTLELSRLYGLKPDHSKGQNFLVEEEFFDAAISAAEIRPTDTVLEVGPGLGFLTEKLAKISQKVVAVELDKKLADFLGAKLITQKIDNVELINDDILKIRDDFFAGWDYKIVANLPYNITSIFLRKFLTAKNKPQSLVLMLQKEVAERIVAEAPQMSILALSVQFYARAEIINIVPAEAFWPQPKVNSALIKIVLKPLTELPPVNQELFWRLVKIGYSAKRKMLKNNLGNGLHLDPPEIEKGLIEIGYNAKVRAQELSLEDWLNLFAKFSGFML
jgi:16S rRNA (adenine1518-N6/adenine1519-N6)-dimethyltransferase